MRGTRGASNAFNVGVCMQPVPKDAQRWRAIPELHEPRAPPVPAARQIDRSHMAYLIMVLIATCRDSRTSGTLLQTPAPAAAASTLRPRLAASRGYRRGTMSLPSARITAGCSAVTCLASSRYRGTSRCGRVWHEVLGSPVCLCWVESKAADRILTGRRPPPELPCPFPINADPKTGSRQFPVSLICS
ncbi:hypothetical protein BHM03_00035811 [Ensete ventricosum]|nr:hypothetical protein BHM03_00035811 [Ensete ventricosum]